VPLQVQFRKGFIYSQFACLVDFLVQQHGQDRFLAYVRELLHDRNHASAFRRLYGVDFATEVERFRRAAQTAGAPGR